MMRNAAKHTARWSYGCVVAVLILVALFTLLARIGLPLLASQKSTIEARVSGYLESPVAIGTLSLRWEGAGPRLLASDVTVSETAQRSVTLDELLIDINLPQSLLRGIPIINELSLVGASLAIEVDATGQLSLHGMESIKRRPGEVEVIPPGENTSGVDVLAWLFNAKKVGLLDTRLAFIDLKTDSQVVFEQLNIRAENDSNKHQLRIDARLPDSLGGRIEAGVDLLDKTGELTRSDGEFYVSAESLDVAALNALLRASGLLNTGRERGALAALDAQASVEIWGRWEAGKLVSARGPLVLEQIRHGVTGVPLLDRVAGQLGVRRGVGATEFSLSDLQAQKGTSILRIEQLFARRLEPVVLIDEGVVGANGDLELAGMATEEHWPVHGQSAPVWQFSGLASELPVSLAVRLLSLVMSDARAGQSHLLQDMSADGVVRNLSVSLDVTSAGPVLNLAGQMDALQLLGNERLPSFGPLNGEIAVVDSVGVASFRAEQMPLVLSASAGDRLSVDSFDATIDMDLRDPQSLLLEAQVELSDNDLNTSSRVTVTMVPGNSPHLDIQSQFDVADVAVLKSWLPRTLMNPGVTGWFDQALSAGELADGELLFFGNVDDFPFEEGEGVFQVKAAISEAALVYLPGWPGASGINGTIELNGLTLDVVASESRLTDFNVSQARATIGNLAAPVLEFSATAGGSFEDLVAFGTNGPLREILQPAIGDMNGTGEVEMDLALTVPLFERPAAEDGASGWRPLQIDGSVFLGSNDVTFGRAGLMLRDAKGAVGFNQSGIRINSLAGRVLGRDVRINGQTVGEGTDANTVVTLTGAMEASDLLAHYGNQLDQFMTGASQWTVNISAPHSEQRVIDEGVLLEVTSDLVGTQLLLPAPFDKGSGTAVPFTLRTAFRQDTVEQLWEVQFGDELAANVRLIDGELHALLLELGASRVADPYRLLDNAGIRLQGAVQSLAADGWIDTIARYIDSFPAGDGDPEPVLPISMNLDTKALVLGSQSLGIAALRADTDETYLNVAISNAALSGTLRYPRRYWLTDTALQVNLDHLHWTLIDALSSGADEDSVQASSGLDPRILPPVEAVVSSLVIDNVRLRELQLRTYPGAHGLDITTLGFAYDTMRLVGQGHWNFHEAGQLAAEQVEGHNARLDLVLQGDDFGVGFDEVGLSEVIEDGSGSVVMKLRWPGPLYQPDIAQLDGSIDINLESGSIVPLEPGAGRMMGLFAIQALPRRLNLDFKDMTVDGLAFTNIVGTATIDDGVVSTPLLRLAGPIGVVDVMGTSDLNLRQFDQQVTVLPRVSSALPIIGAISGGATAGIGALVAAGFLKAMGLDFDRIGLRAYSLKGDWNTPEFAPISLDSLRP